MLSEAQAASVERSCLLGGQTKPRRTFGVPTGLVVALSLFGVLWVVAIIITASFIVIALGAAVVVAAVIAARRVTVEGDGWTRTVLDRLRFQRLRNKPLWLPTEGDIPSAIGRLRFITYNEGAGPICLLHHPNRGGSFSDDGYLTALIEIIGGGDGLRPTSQVNAFGQRYGTVLKSLASSQIPIDQIDIETRSMPTDPAAYREHVEQLLDPNAAPELLASMRELIEVGAGAAETYRSFVTVRMPLKAIQAKTRGHGALPEVLRTASDHLKVAVERLETARYEVRNVLGPQRVGAFIRHTYVPSWAVDDLTGLTSAYDAFTWFGYEHGPDGRSLRVEAGEHGVWWHAAASVPMDGWPTGEVGVRWLEGVVTSTEQAIIRTVKTQHHLLPKRVAQENGLLGLTLDEADVIGEEKKGKASTGERQAQRAASQLVLEDLRTGAAGDRPALRLLVSARDEADLEAARSVLESATESMNIQRLHWYDGRHDLAMVLHLPFARGIKR